MIEMFEGVATKSQTTLKSLVGSSHCNIPFEVVADIPQERLILLVHLLCHASKWGFTLDKLRESTQHLESGTHKHFEKPTVAILKEIYNARAQQIRYENGEIGRSTLAGSDDPVLI